MNQEQALADLQRHCESMPPVRAMGVRVVALREGRLSLAAPLAANVNDKGCAFGGSLAGLMTLAGWGLVTLKLAEAGEVAEVYVADSQLRYLAPLYGGLVAEAVIAPDTDWAASLQHLGRRGRARISIQARVGLPDGGDACSLVAQFAMVRPAG